MLGSLVLLVRRSTLLNSNELRRVISGNCPTGQDIIMLLPCMRKLCHCFVSICATYSTQSWRSGAFLAFSTAASAIALISACISSTL